MPVVGLADGLVERPVLDVKQASSVEGARCDHGGVPTPDKLREKVVGLLTVDDVRKGAVLPLEEHAGVHQDSDEKPRLTLRKTEGRGGVAPSRRGAAAEGRQPHETKKIFPPPRGSTARPPLPLRPP